MRRIFATIALLVAAIIPAAALDLPTDSRVVDAAHVLDDARLRSLEGKLADLEAHTSTRFTVFTIAPEPGVTVEGYGLELRKQWGVNANGNRIALIFSPQTGRSVIQFDRGLSETLPESVTDTIFQQILNPRIRSGDFAGGVTAASESIIRVLSGEKLPDIQPVAQAPQRFAQNNDVAIPATADFPALSGRVVDEAGVLDASTREQLRAKLAALEAKNGTQLVVATVKSLRGNTIEDYANRLFRRWQLGQKGTNNGVLLLHAPAERKIRIEVGYGLEGRLTDAITKVIITNAIAPHFKANDFSGGMTRGVDDIIRVLGGGGEDIKRLVAPSWFSNINPGILFVLIPMAFFIISATVMGGLKLIHEWLVAAGWAKRRPRTGFWHSVDNFSFASGSGSGSYSSSSSSWSSSSSSSSSDSFSGGGGDSGGGGSSGDY
jgi:uncharacterized protein